MADAETTLLTEHTLTVSEFNTSGSVSGLYAVAQLLQTLVLSEPGTWPTTPAMGCGIQAYQFEFLDQQTITQMQNLIQGQVAAYVPTVNLDDVIVEQIPTKDGSKKSVGIMFKIRDTSTADQNTVVLLLNQSVQSSKVVSQIFV